MTRLAARAASVVAVIALVAVQDWALGPVGFWRGFVSVWAGALAVVCFLRIVGVGVSFNNKEN